MTTQPPGPIKHIVYLMLENRTFDKVFGFLQLEGLDVNGVNPRRDWNVDFHNNKFTASPIRPFLGEDYGRNSLTDTTYALNTVRNDGMKNGGFVQSNIKYPYTFWIHQPCPPKDVMGYYPKNSFPVLEEIARNYVLCDNYYSSLPADTTPNRMFALSGTSRGMVVNPLGTWKLWEYRIQCQKTIFDRLNSKGYSWKVYCDTWRPFSLLLTHQWRPWNLFNYRCLNKLYQDIERDSLPAFSFIEPNYSKISIFGKNEDVSYLENLVSKIYTSLKKNPKMWNETLLIINFDESGGFYDHVYPPQTQPPDDHTSLYAFNQYGVRVPCLIASPLIKPQIDHRLYDHTSILATIERLWDLEPLTKRDLMANDFRHLLNF